MSSNRQHDDPDDLFGHTRMSLGDHIEELRVALFRAAQGFGLALVIGFFLAQYALAFIAAPVESQLRVFYLRRLEEQLRTLDKDRPDTLGTREQLEKLNQPKPVDLTLTAATLNGLAKALGLPPREFKPEEEVTLTFSMKPLDWTKAMKEAMMLTNPPPTLSVLSVTEAFLIWMQVSIYCGIVLGSPWIFYQLWMFVAAGLYPQEKKYVHYFLPLSLFLFLGGVVLCELIVLPYGIHWLLQFNEWLGFKPELRLSEWLSFAIMAPLLFGIAFQTPLVMFFLERIGLLSVEIYRANRKMAIFVLFLAAALLAVAPDPISMLSMGVPMCLLYELGILLCAYFPKPSSELDVPETEEMVEV